MEDQSKTKQALIQELASLRQKIEELEQSESEWKNEKEELKKSEARFRSYFDLPYHGIAITSPEKGWIEVNDRLCSIMGYSRGEIVRMTWSEMTHPDDLAADLEQFNRVLSGQIEQYNMDKRFIRKCGKIIWTNLSVGCVRKSDGRVDHIIAVVEDITSVKLAEEAMRESEDQYRSLFDHSGDAILLTAPDGRILAANPEARRIFGRSEEEICRIGRAGLMDLTDPHLAAALEERARTGQFRGELTFVRKDGALFPGEISSAIFRDRDGNSKTSMIVRDITDRKRAEEALTRSEEKFRKAFYTSLDSVNINRLEDGMYISINPGFTRITGYTEGDIIGKTSIEYNVWGNIEDRQRLVAGLRKDGEVINLEATFRMKGGDIRYGLMSASVIDLNGVPHILSITRDITVRKRAEEALRRTEENFRRSLDESPLGVRIVSAAGETIYANWAILDIYGYDSLDELKATTVMKRYTSESFVEFQTRREKRKRGDYLPSDYKISIVRKDGVVRHLQVFRKEILWDGEAQFQVIYRDITDRKRAEEELQLTLESLRKAFGATIQVMVSAVEVRDPYTSGHQIRSADLARAIAMEMGLPQEKIDGIRMAGSIHDIGKLSIPAEILSKPTKLSEIEFSLIKEHAGKGFEMLKDVESPWPLAEIVYQHHERMDGSGYPRGLEGEEILIEARIMAVADVVEAMASHRPYRPGLGIDAALEEIEKNRGTFYDNAVADACLRLFREKGFQLEGARF
ncbi:MAG: PAS domain S-box protein [Deltaproteobacteria bacterium]